MKVLLDPSTDINHSTDTAYTDIDVSGYVGGDAGSVAGVLLQIHNTGADLEVGIRKKGSSQDIKRDINGGDGIQAAVGVDSNDVFELYAEDASSILVYLIGYWTTAEAEFLDAAVDVSPGSFGSWQSVALGGQFTGTVYGAMFWVHNPEVFARAAGIQDVDGPDRFGDHAMGWVGYVTPATSEAVEAYIESAAVEIWVIGAITDSATITPFTQTHDFTDADTYETVDLSTNIPVGGVAAISHVHDGIGEALNKYQASRADGQSFELYPRNWALAYWVTAINTTDRDVNQKCSDAAFNSFFIAYLSEAAAGGGRIMSSLTGFGGGLAGPGGIAGQHGGLAA